MEEYLRLRERLPDNVEINMEKISEFKTEDEFLSLFVEISKEIGIIIILLSSSYKTDTNNLPRKLSRNEAIIIGLLVRIAKLYNSFMQQVCENHSDIAMILSRCIFETSVNLKYLVKKKL